MNRICGTCRYWVRQPSWQREQRGPCQRVMPGHAPDGMPFIQAATAHTRLVTSKGFGCPLWEAQDG
jgi:hypothetical protein